MSNALFTPSERLLRADLPEFERVRELRARVLRDPATQEGRDQILEGDFEPDVIHPALFLGNHLVATARVDHLENSEAYIRRVAVDPEFQGMGFGVRIMRLGERAASAAGLVQISLHSRQTTISFYEKLHYVKTGFDERGDDGIVCYGMLKENYG